MSESISATPTFDEPDGSPDEISDAEQAVSEDVSRVIDLLSSKSPQLEYLQVAQNGEWESAVKLAPEQEVSAPNLDGFTSPNTAVEAFFRLADGSNAFIGFKYPETASQPPAQFVQQLINAVVANRTGTIQGLLTEVGTTISGNPTDYTSRQIDRATLMVVDYWNQLPTETIWRHGDPSIAADTLRAQLDKAPELISNTVNPICLEVDFGAPGLWVGLPISKFDGKNHQLDHVKLVEALNTLPST